ncbi:MAG: TonB-dependent receptor [Sulfurimonas sp.]
MERVKTGIVVSSLLMGVSSVNATEDLGEITVESSTIDEKVDVKKEEVSSVTLIDTETIENINAKNVADILNTVPGVTMALTGTDALKIHIRGVDNQMYMGEKPGVAVVIDGVPVQETTGKINMDLDNIESIKVIKGGASYLYGNDALAGAVVITTKRQKGMASVSKLETEVGSFGYKKLVLSTNQAMENGALQLQASDRESDGYWDDAFVKVKSVNGKYQYYLNDTSDVTVGMDLTKRETGDGNSVRGVTEAETNPKSAGYYSYGGYYDSDLTKMFITYNNDLSDISNFMLRVHRYEDDKSYKLARTTKDMSEVWSQSGAKGEYRTKLGRFALMGGFDIQRNDTDSVSHDALDGDAPRGGNDGDLLGDSNTKEDINALYTEVKHQTTENLTTTLNVRFDDIAYEYRDHLDSSYNVDPDYQTTSFRFGVNYALQDDLALYSSVSTGFRTPTPWQISNNMQLIADPDVNATNIPSEIDVEKTYNYEIGLRGKTNNNLSYALSIYQLDRKDYIGRIAGSYISSDEEEESGYANVGDMRSRGFELEVHSDRSKRFSYDLAYTYLDAKFTHYFISQQQTEDPDGPYRPQTAEYERKDLSGNTVPRSSRHTINLAMNYRVTDSFMVTPEIYYRSSYYADEANAHKQDGYAVANLRMNYSYGESLEFFAKIDNLLDKNYYEFVTVNSSALATMEDATIRVAEPRAYYFGLRYTF